MTKDPGQSDPFEGREREERQASVWFIGAVLLGAFLGLSLCFIDGETWKTRGQFLDRIDSSALNANRLAATSIGSESLDTRQMGDYSSVRNLSNPRLAVQKSGGD